MLPRRQWILPLLLVMTFTGLVGCQTLQQIAQLRNVDFAIDRASQGRLAGVNLDRYEGYADLRATDIARVGAAIAAGNLPLDFTLHLAARNPGENNVAARLVRMDWTLFLEDRETISGQYDNEILLPPGEVSDVPINISLDLMRFFGDNIQDMVDIAMAATGQGGAPRRIHLEATPIIDTRLGPIRYPEPITIVSRDLGGTRTDGADS